MQEPKKRPRIDRHAAGDVADCHQIRPSCPFAPAKHLIDLSTVPCGCAHRRAPCRVPPSWILPPASCRQRSDRKRELLDDAFRLHHFLVCHLLEIEGAQALPPRCGLRGIDLQFDFLPTSTAIIRQEPVRPCEKRVRGPSCRGIAFRSLLVPRIIGSSIDIIRSWNLGSRQNSLKIWLKTCRCSFLLTRQAWRIQWRSSLLVNPAASTARMASVT